MKGKGIKYVNEGVNDDLHGMQGKRYGGWEGRRGMRRTDLIRHADITDHATTHHGGE